MAGVPLQLTTAPPRPDPGRARLTRRLRMLVAFTITYNAVEAFVAVSAGLVASSGALVAFGLDSVIEVSSAAAVAWQFSARDPQARERVTLRMIAFSFFALAAYVSIDAARALIVGGEPGAPTVGLVLAAVSVVVMPAVSLAQRRTGVQLGSASAVADSKQTLLCAGMSAVLLAGLLLNAAFGWAWADPLAALGIAGLALREGVNARRGAPCCALAGSPRDDGPRREDDCCTT